MPLETWFKHGNWNGRFIRYLGMVCLIWGTEILWTS